MMNIIYTKNKDIDKSRWNSCINKSKNGLVYACSWYLDIIAEKWDALIYGDYEFIFPIIWKRKYFIKYIGLNGNFQKLNIFSEKEIPKSLYADFLSCIPTHFLLIDLMIDAKLNFKNSNFFFSEKITYELNLNKPEDELIKQFSKSHKRNIRKAEQIDIEIRKSKNISEVIQMKKLVMERNNIQDSNFISDLEKILVYSQNQETSQCVYSAFNDNELQAAAYFLPFNNKYIIISGTTKEARNTGAMFLLVKQFIKDYAHSNAILDFAGSNIKGIASMNAGFGAKKLEYTYAQRRNKCVRLFNKN